jgi:hypothetical protein
LPDASVGVAKLSQTRQIAECPRQIKASIDHFGFFGIAVHLTPFYESGIQSAGLFNCGEFEDLSGFDRKKSFSKPLNRVQFRK